MRKPESRFAIDGSRQSGETVRDQNVMACMAIANVVKSSFGPVGLDKMLVDDIGDVIITNDGATILKQLEVEHPAAKVLVDLADLQDKEVGDGTTSVVILAAELLKVRHHFQFYFSILSISPLFLNPLPINEKC
jgi:T-complex protein 1 subunit alpha